MKESFDDVMPFFVLWKEQSEYSDRYNKLEKELNTPIDNANTKN
jgi:hypothetical protein